MASCRANCFLFHTDPHGCGDFKGIGELVPISECNADISAHLKRCHLSKECITEKELILMRAGYFSLTLQQMQHMLVCPKHRANLGQYWGNQTRRTPCQYPEHKGKVEGVKSDRAFTVKIAQEVRDLFGVIVPVGSPICNSCRKNHSEKMKHEWSWLRQKDIDKAAAELPSVPIARKSKEDAIAAITAWSPSTPGPPARTESADPQWTPGQWRELQSDTSDDESEVDPIKVYNDAISQIASLSDIKEVEPLTFRLTSNWEDATKTEKLLCEQNVDQACRAVCNVIAPSASKELLEAFKRSSSPGNDLTALTNAYKNAPNKSLKTQILSIYALRYSSTELKTIHAPFENLSDRQIKKAREHAKTVGPGMSIEKAPYHRIRIDLVKLNHFLSFVDQPYFYQDVSYGTRILKLESGEQLVMPNVVRTVGRSTMIEQYLSHCSSEGFESLGRSTLFRILKTRESSQRKSLQGLDNISASGADGLDTLYKIVDELGESGSSQEWCETTRKKLKDGKCYLKTDYRVHCREDNSTCPDHCRRYALSDPQSSHFQSSCDQEHLEECDQCESLKNTMLSVLSEIESPDISFYSMEQKEDLLHDASQARDMVLQWKAHILRAENQDKAKVDALKALTSDSILVVMDWAMKLNQMKYREKQSEWFGKRGMSWHVSCVVSKPVGEQDLEIVSYVHLLDSCAQDWYAVCAILTHLLKNVKADRPHISKAYLRSDGAGCYFNNNLITAVSQFGEQVGIKVMRYDFSEPQFGKDVCDRIISPLKGAIRRYCDEGHDILTASDMYEALQARQVKGTSAVVCEIDLKQGIIEVNRISNFSAFHNFSYGANGLRVSKAYDIGPGKLISWSDLKVQCPGLITVKEFDERSFFAVTPRRMKASGVESEEKQVLFECKEPGCCYVFATFDELEDHTNFGEHGLSVQRQEGIYDHLRRQWAFKFSTLSLADDLKEKLQLSDVERAARKEAWKPESEGWALQKPRGGSRFSENVKSFLKERFNAGAKTGRKADPVQVAADMRKVRNSDGTRKFSRNEWLTKGQVKSFFSRLSTLSRKADGTAQRDVVQGNNDDDDGDDGDGVDDNEDLLEEELEYLKEKRRNEEIDDICSQVGVVHPIMYDGYDLCELVRLDKLSEFTVPTLKAMCKHFELSHKYKDRKSFLMDKIKEMVRECGCSPPGATD